MNAPRLVATFPIVHEDGTPDSEIRVIETWEGQFAVSEYKAHGFMSRGRSGLRPEDAFDLAFEWGGWNITATNRFDQED